MSEGSRPPPLPPAPLQNWSSLNFHCKVNPGQTKKTVGPSPGFGVILLCIFKIFGFSNGGGRGEGGSPNLRTLCLGRSVHVDLPKMAVREGGGV